MAIDFHRLSCIFLFFRSSFVSCSCKGFLPYKKRTSVIPFTLRCRNSLGEISTMDVLSTVDTCDITISLSSKQHLCLTLENVWHVEVVVSVMLQTMSYRTSWKKRGIVQIHLFRIRYCIISKIAKVFFICCLTRQSHCHWDVVYLVEVEFCAVMSDTNMLTTSYSWLIIFNDVELALSLKCYQMLSKR